MAIKCIKCGCNNIDGAHYCAICGGCLPNPTYDTYSVYSDRIVNDLQQKIKHLQAELNVYRNKTNNTNSTYKVELMSGGRAKLAVVKAVKEALGIGLKEAKDLVDSCPSVIKRCATYATAVKLKSVLESEGATVCISIESYMVEMLSCGASKLQVVKIIKEVLGVDLKAAKYIVDNCNEWSSSVIQRNLDYYTATKIKRLLEEGGATVVVRREN